MPILKYQGDTRLPAIIAATRRKMRERGDTQSDIAQHIGVTQGEISKILSGQRRRLTKPIIKLCQYANYDVATDSDDGGYLGPLSQVLREAIDDNPDAEEALVHILHALLPLLRNYTTPGSGHGR